jgi:hypothetical protein
MQSRFVRAGLAAIVVAAGLGGFAATNSASAGEWIWDGYAWRYLEGESYRYRSAAPYYYYDGYYSRPTPVYRYYTPRPRYQAVESYNYWPVNRWYDNYSDRPYSRGHWYNQ